jgi:hypothetical protein
MQTLDSFCGDYLISLRQMRDSLLFFQLLGRRRGM